MARKLFPELLDIRRKLVGTVLEPGHGVGQQGPDLLLTPRYGVRDRVLERRNLVLRHRIQPVRDVRHRRRSVSTLMLDPLSEALESLGESDLKRLDLLCDIVQARDDVSRRLAA